MLNENKSSIQGVLYEKNSSKHYMLKRFYPKTSFASLIEQFWFVSWKLESGNAHTQVNLPDFNFHILLENEELFLIGPTVAKYEYKMRGNGQLFGIKLEIGALIDSLNAPIHSYVDTKQLLSDCIQIEYDEFKEALVSAKTYEAKIDVVYEYLQEFLVSQSKKLKQFSGLLNSIKSEAHIKSVSDLSRCSGLSVRTIQRLFKTFLGITPKKLIKRYRLRRALEMLDKEHATAIDVVAWLGYVDESHLIKEFKQELDITPKAYIS